MQKKTFQLFVFVTALFFGGIISSETSLGADSRYQGTLECGFKEITDDTRSPLVAEKGTVVTITCGVTNHTKEKAFPVFILGKQSFGGVPIASSGTNIALEKGSTAGAVLSFPASFQNGEYEYMLTAVDTDTGNTFAEAVELKAIIGKGAEPAKLEKIVLDKEQYEWGGSFDVTVFLKIAERLVIMPGMFSLRVTMEARDGSECVVLEDSAAVTGATMKLSLNFPSEGQCANTLRVSLRDTDGKVIDQKFVAVGLSLNDTVSSGNTNFVQGLFASMPKIFWIFLALTIILMLALVGYLIVRKRKS